MAKYLIATHQPRVKPVVLQKLKDLHEQDRPTEFTLLTAATLVHHLLFFRGNHMSSCRSPRPACARGNHRNSSTKNQKPITTTATS